MKAIMTGAMLALATTAGAAGAAEEKFTGNSWLPHCKNALVNNKGDDAPQQWECLGMVMALRYAMHFTTNNYGPYCSHVPSSVTNGQLIRVVVKYLEDHPKDLNNNFTHLMMKAIAEAWPCDGEAP
jgi:hypothetical protein